MDQEAQRTRTAPARCRAAPAAGPGPTGPGRWWSAPARSRRPGRRRPGRRRSGRGSRTCRPAAGCPRRSAPTPSGTSASRPGGRRRVRSPTGRPRRRRRRPPSASSHRPGPHPFGPTGGARGVVHRPRPGERGEGDRRPGVEAVQRVAVEHGQRRVGVVDQQVALGRRSGWRSTGPARSRPAARRGPRTAGRPTTEGRRPPGPPRGSRPPAAHRPPGPGPSSASAAVRTSTPVAGGHPVPAAEAGSGLSSAPTGPTIGVSVDRPSTGRRRRRIGQIGEAARAQHGGEDQHDEQRQRPGHRHRPDAVGVGQPALDDRTERDRRVRGPSCRC